MQVERMMRAICSQPFEGHGHLFEMQRSGAMLYSEWTRNYSTGGELP
jgi:hypothetical protein